MSPISDVTAFRAGRWPLEGLPRGDPGRRRPGDRAAIVGLETIVRRMK
jgi:hypothetical protein